MDSNLTAMTPVEEFLQVDGNPHKPVIPKGISKITELTLDQFENNYQLFAQKLADIDTSLVIRAILLKNNEVIFNYSFKIIGTDNVQNATIAAANKVCNLYLVCALKGDTLICSLGAGHNGVHVSITRNMHIANFIATLNKIKDTTGLYIIVTALNCDWLEYAGGNTTYEDLIVVPNKKTIIPILEMHLNNLWCNKWSGLRGHHQTKYWLTKPDPFLANKIMNMSRENLGMCIQFFSGHGWWKKHLTVAKLCNDVECRLCCEEGSEESPIHIFSECVAMANTRQGLFNNPFPMQLVGRESLCQVSKLVFVDMICDLIDKNQNYSNISLTE